MSGGGAGEAEGEGSIKHNPVTQRHQQQQLKMGSSGVGRKKAGSCSGGSGMMTAGGAAAAAAMMMSGIRSDRGGVDDDDIIMMEAKLKATKAEEEKRIEVLQYVIKAFNQEIYVELLSTMGGRGPAALKDEDGKDDTNQTHSRRRQR